MGAFCIEKSMIQNLMAFLFAGVLIAWIVVFASGAIRRRFAALVAISCAAWLLLASLCADRLALTFKTMWAVRGISPAMFVSAWTGLFSSLAGLGAAGVVFLALFAIGAWQAGRKPQHTQKA